MCGNPEKLRDLLLDQRYGFVLQSYLTDWSTIVLWVQNHFAC
ncbi:hypothetical protein FM113_13445 [Leucobacter sp. 7(1)]|nr:hypothetical protein FM113_13445 [Leucobacter sp. 7(1)]